MKGLLPSGNERLETKRASLLPVTALHHEIGSDSSVFRQKLGKVALKHRKMHVGYREGPKIALWVLLEQEAGKAQNAELRLQQPLRAW